MLVAHVKQSVVYIDILGQCSYSEINPLRSCQNLQSDNEVNKRPTSSTAPCGLGTDPPHFQMDGVIFENVKLVKLCL